MRCDSQSGEKKTRRETEDKFTEEDEKLQTDRIEAAEEIERKRLRKYVAKHMRQYPELCRSDVSIHPSYTGLRLVPYSVVCRRRVQRTKKQIKRQLNQEIMHFAMMQMFAIDSVRIDRVFNVGMPPKTLIVPDLLTADERRYVNELVR